LSSPTHRPELSGPVDSIDLLLQLYGRPPGLLVLNELIDPGAPPVSQWAKQLPKWTVRSALQTDDPALS
jgi:hypothetical protein